MPAVSLCFLCLLVFSVPVILQLAVPKLPRHCSIEDSPAAMLIAVHFNPDHNIITAIAIYSCPAGIKAPELGARCTQETVGAVRSCC